MFHTSIAKERPSSAAEAKFNHAQFVYRKAKLLAGPRGPPGTAFGTPLLNRPHAEFEEAIALLQQAAGELQELGADLSIVEEPEAQLIKMFDNLGLVLTEAGCDWNGVVEMTAFLTELQRDYTLFMHVRDRYISEPYPAMTMIGAAELAQPGLICELKAVAVISV